jgi:hypothetical protein
VTPPTLDKKTFNPAPMAASMAIGIISVTSSLFGPPSKKK